VVTYGPGRWGGTVAGMLVPPLLVLLLLVVGASFSAGRFGDDEVPLGLIEDGGVTEL